MCDILSIYKQKDIFLQLLEQKKSETKAQCDNGHINATSLQRVWRGNRARMRIYLQSCAVTKIARVHRGHMGRLKAKLQLKLKNESRLLSMFFYFALQLQRSFRGYYSRKYRHNFYSRKQYIQGLIAKGEEVRARLDNYNREVIEREQQEEQLRKDEEFRKHAQDLHHLTSTRQVRGVFNPPAEFMNVPTLHDIAVEDHIRGVVRDLLRSRNMLTKTGLVPDLHGSRKVPLKGLKNRLSVQASAPYDAVRVDKQRTQLLHRLLTAEKGNWQCGGKTTIIDHKDTPLCVGDPFVDAWGNPLKRRGVPASQKQLLESTYTRKALFVTHEDRPFYVRAEGNKSSALPNDIFDVIAEAEESGGAAQRFMGTSARFGLPTSADNRPPDGNGTIPAPPLRTSTIKNSRNPGIRKKKVISKPHELTDGPKGISARHYDESSDDD